jgi:hypothetical protein
MARRYRFGDLNPFKRSGSRRAFNASTYDPTFNVFTSEQDNFTPSIAPQLTDTFKAQVVGIYGWGPIDAAQFPTFVKTLNDQYGTDRGEHPSFWHFYVRSTEMNPTAVDSLLYNTQTFSLDPLNEQQTLAIWKDHSKVAGGSNAIPIKIGDIVEVRYFDSVSAAEPIIQNIVVSHGTPVNVEEQQDARDRYYGSDPVVPPADPVVPLAPQPFGPEPPPTPPPPQPASADIPFFSFSYVIKYSDDGGFDMRHEADGGPVKTTWAKAYITDSGARAILRPPTTIKALTLHWPGGPSFYSPYRTYRACVNGIETPVTRSDGTVSGRFVGSHYAIGNSEETGQIETYQYLPHEYTAYHAGWPNRWTIGIDICCPVVASDLDAARGNGWDPEIKDTPQDLLEMRRPPNSPERTAGGWQRRYIDIPDEFIEPTRRLVFDLCRHFGIPEEVPRLADGRVNHALLWTEGPLRFNGVLGHHHTQKTRWDIFPWWRKLFNGTSLGDDGAPEE